MCQTGSCRIGDEDRQVAFKEPHLWSNRRIRQVDLDRTMREIMREIKMMSKLRFNENIVQIYGVTFQENYPILVVELATEILDIFLADRLDEGNQVNWHHKALLCLDVLRGIRGF